MLTTLYQIITIYLSQIHPIILYLRKEQVLYKIVSAMVETLCLLYPRFERKWKTMPL